ncbi:MAG: hypothetical protein A2511_07970 [Deltaproteobacteria bacterium RIFOXYD12_FULL_50_9]|nr:MAG: hypothetical protein A2511_07970 [Deltaproteobacteria bacterium RIFOXYD12_FULL_50_9]
MSLFIASSALAQSPTSREYPYLYKSPRAMGMGGAYTAIGGTVDTLFYNPAGLSMMPKDKGWEVDVINIRVEAGNNVMDLYDDLNTAFDTGDLNNDGKTDDDQLRATNDVLEKYQGENVHFNASDFTAIGNNFEKFAFGIGGVGNLRADAMVHQGFGSEGLLEVNADATYGAIGGCSMMIKDNIFVGLTLKFLNRESLVHNFTSRELVEKQDSLDAYITDELRETGSAVGVDTGVIWKFAQESWFKPSVGASVLNIGDLKFGDAGTMPMTVNTGIAMSPEIPYFRSLIIGADYVDLLSNYSQDKDMMKRFRIGAELQLFDVMMAALALRAGFYQGNPTFGVDLRLLIFDLQYVAYTEEIGAYAGQEKDRRQLMTLNIGW